MPTTRKSPNRKKDDVSESFNDGRLTVFAVENEAPPGYAPKAKLYPILSLNYEERELGFNRYFAGRQNMVKIERVIRIPKPNVAITSDNVIRTETGAFYSIAIAQHKTETYPPCIDLTLVKYEGTRKTI